eukprot:767545-Hanusia_phi.AAC.1
MPVPIGSHGSPGPGTSPDRDAAPGLLGRGSSRRARIITPEFISTYLASRKLLRLAGSSLSNFTILFPTDDLTICQDRRANKHNGIMWIGCTTSQSFFLSGLRVNESNASYYTPCKTSLVLQQVVLKSSHTAIGDALPLPLPLAARAQPEVSRHGRWGNNPIRLAEGNNRKRRGLRSPLSPLDPQHSQGARDRRAPPPSRTHNCDARGATIRGVATTDSLRLLRTRSLASITPSASAGGTLAPGQTSASETLSFVTYTAAACAGLGQQLLNRRAGLSPGLYSARPATL